MTGYELRNFTGYLHTLTAAQLRGCWLKETRAGRDDYAALVEIEAARRNIDVKEGSE
jgi:hypothetical protein